MCCSFVHVPCIFVQLLAVHAGVAGAGAGAGAGAKTELSRGSGKDGVESRAAAQRRTGLSAGGASSQPGTRAYDCLSVGACLLSCSECGLWQGLGRMWQCRPGWSGTADCAAGCSLAICCGHQPTVGRTCSRAGLCMGALKQVLCTLQLCSRRSSSAVLQQWFVAQGSCAKLWLWTATGRRSCVALGGSCWPAVAVAVAVAVGHARGCFCREMAGTWYWTVDSCAAAFTASMSCVHAAREVSVLYCSLGRCALHVAWWFCAAWMTVCRCVLYKGREVGRDGL